MAAAACAAFSSTASTLMGARGQNNKKTEKLNSRRSQQL
eukprot:CAMPEP_0197604298 /NCGR_PEP_ID=MMETSP1326-20131121/40885_1 /TAXON_ID=1155430 /ORGANISM="Genus nov. species nov., Strain RCC2288" /LENGTH=38 /DNA_ID= /DNA_START= /DNA_END= /DNA_ORIENTATION=